VLLGVDMGEYTGDGSSSSICGGEGGARLKWSNEAGFDDDDDEGDRCELGGETGEGTVTWGITDVGK